MVAWKMALVLCDLSWVSWAAFHGAPLTSTFDETSYRDLNFFEEPGVCGSRNLDSPPLALFLFNVGVATFDRSTGSVFDSCRRLIKAAERAMCPSGNKRMDGCDALQRQKKRGMEPIHKQPWAQRHQQTDGLTLT